MFVFSLVTLSGVTIQTLLGCKAQGDFFTVDLTWFEFKDFSFFKIGWKDNGLMLFTRALVQCEGNQPPSGFELK